MIRVVLADDHGIIRDGLGRLITSLDDIELVGVAADGAQAVEQCRLTSPDVVLMDLDMPVLDGIEATRRILAERPGWRPAPAATCSRTSTTRPGPPRGWPRPPRPTGDPARSSLAMQIRLTLTALCLALALLAPASALARGGGDDDVRVTGTCGKGASSQLRLRAKDGAIQVEFEVKTHRGGQRWRVVLVHERRVVWRGRARTRSGSGSFRIRRSLPDFGGSDQVTARASGPRGNTCGATALLTGA